MGRENKEAKKGNGGVSRRRFIRDAGFIFGGVAVGSVMLGSPGVLDAQGPPDHAKGPPEVVPPGEQKKGEVKQAEGYIVIDTKKCSGCNSCMMACAMVHDGETNLSFSRIQIAQNTYGRFPEDIMLNQCRQCVYPVCVDSCPVGACYIDKDNGYIRVIDEEACVGCRRCLNACPYIPHRAIWNHEKRKAMKCDLCLNTPFWSEEGGINGKQACVEACPMKAIKMVEEVPSQRDTGGYVVNLRNEWWEWLGLPMD